MLTLVRKARRRLFCNELLVQAANTISAALAVFILLLLLGTDVLGWQWTIVLPAVALVAGIFLARRRTPSLYRAAQFVDARLRLHDALSTAFYFHRNPSRSASPELIELQAKEADALAASVAIRDAVPLKMPRTVYAMGALALIASSLFALRFGIDRRLDLRAPLARILQQRFNFPERQVLAKNQATPPEKGTSPEDQEFDQAGEQPGKQPGDDLNNAGDPQDGAKPESNGPGKQAKSDDASQEPQAEGEQSPNEQPGKDGQSGGESKSGQQGKSDMKKEGSKSDANNSNENTSLLDKLKDAMQNLLSKVSPPQNASGQQQSAANQKQSTGKQQGKQDAKDGKQSNGQQGEGQQGQSGEQADGQAEANGKSQGKSDSPQNTKQQGNGMGSQDGDKSIREAEQLAAMGKISEIIGKRSANISGEATVEVNSTKQQLRTPYAQRGAQHTQAGAEISRDEIPAALQGYVQQYFEQVRKQPAPAAAAKKGN